MSGPSVHVRPAVQADAPVLSALIRGLGLFRRFDSESADTTGARVASHLRMCLADDSHTVLVAETPEGELAGYAATCDAFHITQPDPEGKGLSMAMKRALASAAVAPTGRRRYATARRRTALCG